MAEFKLGRIRFVWKDEWTNGTVYYKDDVVKYGGKTYICQVGHTADSNFYTDLDFVPTKWNQMNDGQDWKGDWQSATFYKQGDIVKYGGLVYICFEEHTSAVSTALGLEADQAKWNLFSEGVDWKGNWGISTRYKVNDLVKYGGYTYVCVTQHTSAGTASSGLEADQAKWEIFNPGIEYLGEWSGSSVRYKLNDVVKYGAGLWICVTQHSSNASFATDQAKWTQFVKGVEFQDEWSSSTVYQVGDIVSYGGNQYVAKTNHSNSNPVTGTTNWSLFSKGFNFVSTWSGVTAYKVGDVVSVNGYTYVASADSTNQEPPNGSFWQRLTAGIFWRGEWIDDVLYKLGDAVRFGSNAYICVQGHRSEGDDGSTIGAEGGGAANSRPDQDITGTYWNVLAIGSESSVLTTKGDLLFYSGSGPARLPIGIEGQVLVAGEEYPEWQTLNVKDNVYYVKPDGRDQPAPVFGKTENNAFRTIRYACEQIERGPNNPNAKRLLELNRAFIQREVTEWIDRQVTTNTAPFTTSFDYDEYKCERDTGFIVDALIYDIGHGGNVKSREAALAYVGALTNGPGVYSRLSAEKEADVAAFTYMVTLVDKVLAQQAPAVNYQTLNGDNSTAIVEQFFDATIDSEAGVIDQVTDLVGIITDAITAESADNIPARYLPATLISVATGQYREILPIIVPENTCVQGDELRSTHAGPREATTDAADSAYSIGALGRLESIITNIIGGSAITPASGNTETQDIAVPFASAEDALAARRLVRTIQHSIDWRIGEQNLVTISDPTDYNVGYLAGYGDARKLVRENKKFLQAEVIAYLTANYASVKYSKTRFKDDVGYMVDAVVYDLSYGGNAQTVTAGAAFYEDSVYIGGADKTATVAAYGFLKSRLQSVSTNATITPLQVTVPQYRDTAGSAGASTFIGTNLDTAIAIINTGTIPAATTPSTSWVAGGLTSASSTLAAATATIKTNTTGYISSTFPSLVYNSVKCERDVGLILDAVRFDFMFNSNFQTLKAAHAYLRSSASEVYSLDQKSATRSAFEYVRTQARSNVGGDTTAQARINTLFTLLDDVIFSGSNEAQNYATDRRTLDHAVLQLERNRDFITADVNAFIASTYRGTVTATTVTTNLFTISSTAWLRRNAAVRFSGTVIGGVQANITYYVQKVTSSTQFTVAITRNATDNQTLTLSTASGSMTVALFYDAELCTRDINEYISAVKHDLKYVGNYKSLLAARYYANSVTGSLEEDMYYMRNSTGLRDQTLEGLTGDLLAPNAYGTSRVSAGAYVSLDPGWGPDDQTPWIIARSPYVQGVTTFGYAAIGQKIDGALHNGGNDSIVSNDFTQVISDGIGAWVTNNGRAELVSVFSYYSHIGYLAEAGGRIRGTNGNNSYGDFGSVAEGFDATETPNTAVVDNKQQFKATIGNVFGNGANIFRLEFDHAGNEYSEVEYLYVGGGGNATSINDEFRDDAVYQIRLLGTGDDSSGQFGGAGYLVASNTAQGGTTSSLTLAATDDEASSAYVGMKLFITGGSGVGQFGIISSYNSGTKVAQIIKETTGAAGWDHVIAGTTIATPDASSTYTIEPNIAFTAPGFTSTTMTLPTSGNWADAVFGQTNEVYTGLTGTYSGTGASGATFQVIRNGAKYIVSTTAAGTGYTRLETITIAGTSLGGTATDNNIVITITSVNSITGAIQAYDVDGRGCGGRFVAVRTGSQVGATSEDGISWTTRATLMPSGANWSALATAVYADGSSVAKSSRFVAVASGSASAASSEDGLTWTARTLVTSAAWTDVTFGNDRFVAIASDSTTVRISLDGEVWDITGTLPSTGYTAIAYGRGLFVAVRSGTTVCATSTNGVTWTARTLPASSAWNSVSWGNGRFVTVATDSNSGAYSLDGVTWTAMTLGAADGSSVAGYQRVAYGQGLFMATTYLAGVEDYSFVSTSEDGINWTTRGVTNTVGASSGWKALAFGNPHNQGRWVALQFTSGQQGVSIRTGATAKARAVVAEEKIFVVRIIEPGSGYNTAPTMTITDPNNTFEAPFSVRIGKGALANPTFTNRGTSYTIASAEISTGNGFADNYQYGGFVAVRRITSRPVAGSNVVFGHLPGRTFKLVSVLTFLGANDGSYTAFFQVSPSLEVFESPENGESATTRIRYSQVRLTGHDFLDIGTGNLVETNYPGTPTQVAIPANETVENNGGRVFFTSTDQDGNFRVGDLFAIEQSTGVATLNADAFNISGLQELNLGNVTLGGGSATITEFSTDPFFTQDSDNIVPTQRAIRAYIANQIGGGGASLNVNSVTAGSIIISSNQISTITNTPIKMRATFEFRGGITGLPLAFNFFLT